MIQENLYHNSQDISRLYHDTVIIFVCIIFACQRFDDNGLNYPQNVNPMPI